MEKIDVTKLSREQLEKLADTVLDINKLRELIRDSFKDATKSKLIGLTELK
jgi:hypothetical protein